MEKRKAVTFLAHVTDGALAGCNDGTLTLIEEASGRIKWETKIGKGLQRPNIFHGEFNGGGRVVQEVGLPTAGP